MKTYELAPSSPLMADLIGIVRRHQEAGVKPEDITYSLVHSLSAVMAGFPLETDEDRRNEAKFIAYVDEQLRVLSRAYRDAARTLRRSPAGEA